MSNKMTLYYNPQSRAAIARWMLEEVGADYDLVHIDFESGNNRRPDFLAINPMGKLPTLVLADGTVLTETPAIVAYLADAHADKGLAPEIGSTSRGTYYRWLMFNGSCLEPAAIEKMMRKDAAPLPKVSVGWGSYDDVVDTLEMALGKSPYLLGERFSAADLMIGATLSWLVMFGAPRVGDSPVIAEYVERVTDRDAYRRSQAA